MHFSRSGTGDPPVILVHGFACDSSDWQAQVDELKQLTTVIACDLRGHGQSAGEGAEFTIEAYGTDVAALIADLGLPPAVLVGHSMGCRVALQAYLKAPDQVSGIVLLDGSFAGRGDPATAQREIATQIAATGYSTYVHDFFDQMFFDPYDPVLKAAIIERALALPEDIGVPLFIDLVGWDAREMEFALASVRVPLMLIHTTTLKVGEGRQLLGPQQTSPWLELARENAPDIEIVRLSGAGHFPQIEMADDVNALLTRFVSDLRQL